MSDIKKAKTCPKCGGTMTFRLGDFECAECGHTEPAQPSPEGKARLGAPIPPESAMPGAEERLSSGISTYRPTEQSARYGPASGLKKEKMLFVGVFMLKSVVTVFIHSSQAGWGYTVPFLAQDAIWLGLLLLALFAPFVPLKRGCMGCSGCIAFLIFTVPFIGPGIVTPTWILAILAIGSLMLMAVQGSSIILIDYFTYIWIGILLNMAVYLWLASILYRDIRWRKRQEGDGV